MIIEIFNIVLSEKKLYKLIKMAFYLFLICLFLLNHRIVYLNLINISN